jgi:hypothetical protein
MINSATFRGVLCARSVCSIDIKTWFYKESTDNKVFFALGKHKIGIFCLVHPDTTSRRRHCLFHRGIVTLDPCFILDLGQSAMMKQF